MIQLTSGEQRVNGCSGETLTGRQKCSHVFPVRPLACSADAQTKVRHRLGAEAGASSATAVVLLTWDHTPDATSWIGHIVFPSWNQVNMAVWDGLPGCGSGIDAHVKSSHGPILVEDESARMLEESIQGLAFRLGGLEIVRDVPTRDHK